MNVGQIIYLYSQTSGCLVIRLAEMEYEHTQLVFLEDHFGFPHEDFGQENRHIPRTRV